jgi:OPA family glycerol-3-phosphate transporter-like MFS transporter
MPFAAGAVCVPAMAALWAVNGFSQAMFWPPLVKVVADNLRPDAFKGAVFWVSMAADIAIIAVFLLVSGCIRFADWRLSFAVVSASALAMAAVWAAVARRLAPSGCSRAVAQPRGGETPSPPGGRRGMWPLLAASGLFAVMAAIVMQGIMRDGIEVWASSIVKDQYGLGTSGSIFSVSLLPVFAAASMVAARAIRRALGDEIKGAALLFAVALACAVILFATNGATMAVGLPLLALISACMYGANLLLIGELPGRFVRHGRVGTVSGLLNAFTYVGAAISIYGFAALRERFDGWRPVFGLWIAVLAAAIALCLLALRKWLPFTKAK